MVVAPVAVLVALEIEAAGLIKRLEPDGTAPVPMWRGELDGVSVVLVVSGVGKVNAALAAQVLCDFAKPRAVLVAGIAGAVQDGPRGQVIVATGAVQHDFDARPLTKARGEIPGLGAALLKADPRIIHALREAIPGARLGVVLTGDQIIAERETRDRIVKEFPDGACFDMETAAVAQVALANGVPWGAVRITSDSADESFNLKEVLGFGAGPAAELLEKVLIRAAGSLLRSS